MNLKNLMEKRNKYNKGSKEWRKINRAILGKQMYNQIDKQLKTNVGREQHVIRRARGYLTDYERKQKENWMKRDVRRVRDDILSTYDYFD